ncbi:arylesterase [Rhizobium sp. ARZ01]|uniref:arylesterase n=1 Tax=Rhizobium sp. ARZ01 TaxID=2769313 RepID=UPI001FEF61FE|nr:arylesterase [Rhizobium sp. ARZ01]
MLAALTLARTAMADPIALVGFGDSLMAGYQLPAEEAFLVQLEKALQAKGLNVAIANAGVSGDTTSGGVARIDWSVPDGTKGVILELGANDALRGIPPKQTEQNLDKLVSGLRSRGIAVLLVGMLAPPNMGEDYAKSFNGIFERIAKKHGVPLYPFFLEGVVTHADLQLDDGMHPNGKGIAVMVEKMLPTVEAFVKSLGVTD